MRLPFAEEIVFTMRARVFCQVTEAIKIYARLPS